MKKKILAVAVLTVLLAVSGVRAEEPQNLCPGFAPEQGVMWRGSEWNGATRGEYPNRNCDIVSIGREPARTDSVPYADAQSALQSARDYAKELSPYYLLLSQTEWKFF